MRLLCFLRRTETGLLNCADFLDGRNDRELRVNDVLYRRRLMVADLGLPLAVGLVREDRILM